MTSKYNFVVHNFSENGKSYEIKNSKQYTNKHIISAVLPTVYNIDDDVIIINDTTYNITSGLYIYIDDFISEMNNLSNNYNWSVDKITLKIKVTSTSNIDITPSLFTRYILGFSDKQLSISDTSIIADYTYNLFPYTFIGIYGDRFQNNINVGNYTYSSILTNNTSDCKYSYNIINYSHTDYYSDSQINNVSRSSDSNYRYFLYLIYPNNERKLLNLHGQTVKLIIKRLLTF